MNTQSNSNIVANVHAVPLLSINELGKLVIERCQLPDSQFWTLSMAYSADYHHSRLLSIEQNDIQACVKFIRGLEGLTDSIALAGLVGALGITPRTLVGRNRLLPCLNSLVFVSMMLPHVRNVKLVKQVRRLYIKCGISKVLGRKIKTSLEFERHDLTSNALKKEIRAAAAYWIKEGSAFLQKISPEMLVAESKFQPSSACPFVLVMPAIPKAPVEEVLDFDAFDPVAIQEAIENPWDAYKHSMPEVSHHLNCQHEQALIDAAEEWRWKIRRERPAGMSFKRCSREDEDKEFQAPLIFDHPNNVETPDFSSEPRVVTPQSYSFPTDGYKAKLRQRFRLEQAVNTAQRRLLRAQAYLNADPHNLPPTPVDSDEEDSVVFTQPHSNPSDVRAELIASFVKKFMECGGDVCFDEFIGLFLPFTPHGNSLDSIKGMVSGVIDAANFASLMKKWMTSIKETFNSTTKAISDFWEEHKVLIIASMGVILTTILAICIRKVVTPGINACIVATCLALTAGFCVFVGGRDVMVGAESMVNAVLSQTAPKRRKRETPVHYNVHRGVSIQEDLLVDKRSPTQRLYQSMAVSNPNAKFSGDEVLARPQGPAIPSPVSPALGPIVEMDSLENIPKRKFHELSAEEMQNFLFGGQLHHEDSDDDVCQFCGESPCGCLPMIPSRYEGSAEIEGVPSGFAPHAGGWMNVVSTTHRFFLGLFDLKQTFVMLKLFNDSCHTIRNLSHFFKYLIALLPSLIQDKILNKFPTLLTSFMFDNSSWKLYRSRMDDMRKKLEKPTTPLLGEARKLADEARRYLNVHAAEPWVTKGDADLKDFENHLKQLAAKVKTAMFGKTPLVIQLTGIPNIGKSQALVALNEYLSAVYTGRKDPLAIYSRGMGQYWEGIGNACIVTYSSFRESTDEINNLQTTEVMDICNPGGFSPSAAEIAKKDLTYCFGAVTLSSNTNYHCKIPGMDGRDEALTAFNRRIANKWMVVPNDDYLRRFDCFRGRQEPIDGSAIQAWLKTQTAAQTRDSPHLLFYPITTLPKQPCTYEKGNLLFPGVDGLSWKSCIDETVNVELRDYGMENVDNGEVIYPDVRHGLSLAQMCRILGRRALAHGKHGEEVTQAMSSAVDDMLRRDGFCADPNAILIADVEVPKELQLWHKVLIGLATMASVSAIVGGALFAYYKSQKPTPIEGTEPHYASARHRDIKTQRMQEQIARARLLGMQPHGSDDTNPLHAFFNKLDKHTVRVAYYDEDSNFIGDMHGFLINGQNVITVRHLFMPRGKFVPGYVELEYLFEAGSMKQRFAIEEKDLQDVAPLSKNGLSATLNDIIYINFSQPIPGIRDIRGMFFNEAESERPFSYPIARTTRKGTDSGAVLKRFTNGAYDAKEAPGYEMFAFNRAIMFSGLSVPGYCGAPLWSMVNGSPKFVGIATGGNHGISIGACLTREVLENIPIAGIRQMDVVETVAHCFLPDVFEKTEDIEIAEGNYAKVGKLPHAVGTNSRSQLKETPFLDRSDIPESLRTEGCMECRVAPACLDSRIIPEMEKKYGIIRKPIPIRLLKWAELASDLHYPVPKRPLREWSLLEAVNAIPSDASMGFGWKCRRRDVLEFNPVLACYFPSEILIRKVDAILETIRNGEIPLTVITPCLKDETLKLQKVLDRATRTFQISPLEMLIIGTMVLGDYMEYMHKNPIHRPSTVGLDPASIEWHLVFSQVLHPDWEDETFLVDLDYKAMEANVTWQLFESYLRHTTRYYRDEGRPSWFARKAYLLMMCQSLQAVGKTVYLRNVGNPSGMKGTTDLNTYCAGIFAMCAFKFIRPAAQPRDFLLSVVSKFNGDDTVLGVMGEVAKTYNFLTIRDFLARLGTVITPAQKGAEATPFIGQEVVQFCKKNILFSVEHQAYVPFVSFATLLDQLSYARDVTFEGLVQIINSALQWSFFRGRRCLNGQIPNADPTFDQQREYFLSKIPPAYHPLIFDWDELMYRYQHPRSMYSEDTTMFSTTYEQLNAESVEQTSPQTTVIRTIPHASLIAPIISGLLGGMHGPTNPSPPVVAPSVPGLTIQLGSTSNVPTSNMSVEQPGTLFTKPHSSSKMPAVPIMHGALVDPSFNSHNLTTIMDDNATSVNHHGAEHFQTEKDEMSHDFFINHFQPIDKLFIPASATPETFLKGYDMAPFERQNVPVFDPKTHNTGGVITRLDLVALTHAFWHGSLKFLFRFFGPREMTFRLAACYIYGELDTGSITYEQAVQWPTVFMTFDASNREYQITIPDINKWRWKHRFDLVPTDASSEKEAFQRMSNGTLMLWLVSPVSGINIDLNINPYLYVMKCGGEDLTFHKFQPMPGMMIGDSNPDPNDSFRAGRPARLDVEPYELVSPQSEKRNGPIRVGRPHAYVPETVAETKPKTYADARRMVEEEIRRAEEAGKNHVRQMQLDAENALAFWRKVNPSFEDQDVRFGAPHAAIPTEESKVLASADQLQSGTAVENPTARTLAAVNNDLAASKRMTNTTSEPVEVAKLAMKYFTLGQIQLAAGTEVVLQTYDHPIDTLKAQSALLVHTGRYYRGNFRLLISVVSGAFSGGNAIVAFVPYGDNATLPTVIDTKWLTGLPYALIDYASDEPVELVIPYTYFLDYFDKDLDLGETLPTAGRIIIFQEDYIFPATGARPTLLNIQGRWEDFETFVPRNIPEISSVVRTKPHAAVAEQVTLHNTVTSSTSKTAAEMSLKTTIIPFESKPIAGGRGSFADQLNRPVIWYSASIPLEPGDNKLISLPNYPQNSPPGGSTVPNDGFSNFFNILANCYAAFYGDTVYDVVYRCDTTGVAGFVVSSISADPLDGVGAISQTPLIYKDTDYYPSRCGGSAPSDGFVASANLPTTTFQVPGKIQVRNPMYTQTRYVGSTPATNIPSQNFMQACTCIEAPAEGATGEKWVVKAEIYRSLAPGARFALFRGMPKISWDVLRTKKVSGSGSFMNYPNSKLTIL